MNHTRVLWMFSFYSVICLLISDFFFFLDKLLTHVFSAVKKKCFRIFKVKSEQKYSLHFLCACSCLSWKILQFHEIAAKTIARIWCFHEVSFIGVWENTFAVLCIMLYICSKPDKSLHCSIFFFGGGKGITKKETRKYTALALDNSDTQSDLKGN